MTGTEKKTTGGCMCGAVRYEATGKPLSTIYCHCTSCRKHTGAPVVTLVGYKREQVSYTTKEPKIYKSSPEVGRAFCDQCGTPLTWEGDGGELGPLVELLISTLDNPEAFTPECHIHHAERLSWFESTDTLPRYRVWDDEEPYLTAPAT
jgi:hypothetical protein